MLYSDVLLDAAKSVSVADDDADALTRGEKRLWSGYLRNAIARFNNNPAISIGTEKVILRNWHKDGISHFKRIVRSNRDRNNLHPIDQDDTDAEVSISKTKWRGVDGRTVQEIPQRLVSATLMDASHSVSQYRIVNEKNFFEMGRTSNIICYAPEENQGIVRVWQPADLLLLFDRAILFPWETKPGESKIFNPETGEYDEYDPLEVQIMIPTSHVPYLVCLAALEIANGIKCDQGMIAQLKDQLASQERELMRSNARDRVKTSFSNRDYASSFWAGRGE